MVVEALVEVVVVEAKVISSEYFIADLGRNPFCKVFIVVYHASQVLDCKSSGF